MALTIGQVADAADVNIQTIRYYERRGLFPKARRTPSGYRQYAEDAVHRLRFIKHAQELGFSLQEIQELLGLAVQHGAACDAVERTTKRKIEVVWGRVLGRRKAGERAQGRTGEATTGERRATGRADALRPRPRFSDTSGWSNRLSHNGGIIYVQGPAQTGSQFLRAVPDWVAQMKSAVDVANR